jgi:hypothetical protein
LRIAIRSDGFFWWFFGIYAGFCILWLILAAATLLSPSLVPGSTVAHGEVDALLHGDDLVLSAGTLALGLFVAWLDPRNPTARPFAVGLVGTALGFSLTAHHLVEVVWPKAMGPFVWSPVPMLHVVFHLIAGAAYTYALLLFPDGRLPQRSRLTIPAFGSVLLAALGLLLFVGREPSYFILYCGLAVVTAGIFAQWHKSTFSEDPAARRQSRGLLHAFLLATVIAGVLAIVEWLTQWHTTWGINLDESDHMSATTVNIVLTAVPPLIAGSSIVVLVGVLQYEMWGVASIKHKPRLWWALIVVVMAMYVLGEALIHLLVDAVGHKFEVGLSATAIGAVLAGVALLEHPQESMKEHLRPLVYGVDHVPATIIDGFSRDLESSVSAEAVVPTLASVLRRELGVSSGRLTIHLAGGRQRRIVWPPGAVLPEREMPLVENGTHVGGIAVIEADGRGDRPSHLKLVHDLGLRAAEEVRIRSATTDPAPPSVPMSDADGRRRTVNFERSDPTPEEMFDERHGA